VIQGSGAGGLQSSFAVTALEVQQPLSGPQMVEDAMREECVDQLQATFADLVQLGVHGHELLFEEDLHGLLRGAQPQ